eukprot:COSAG02_NODE_4462_length_5335_cov_42.590718_2_plen_495_part_00
MQDSDNCKLELTLAKQNKVPIVPVKMQGNSWAATEWLGAVTAGLLYTPMHDDATAQQNIQGLIDQVRAAAPTIALKPGTASARAADPKPAPVSGIESEEMLGLRSEIDGLRKDLAKAVAHHAPTSSSGGAVEGKSLAPIPAEVPPLSVSLRPTPDMLRLKQMLIGHDGTASSNGKMAVTSQKSKVGALGMGGIGKTVTASWLARDVDIRTHFEVIVWVTLGQTPVLERMKALIHLQLTGDELAADTSPEQAKERITVAMRGVCVLLILDDCWEEEHEKALNYVDTTTASKVLITTRIRGLGGASQLELGLPSEDESVKMLLSSAGLAHLDPVPPEASEVVQIAGRLPLAVDLAGSMLRDFGVSGKDWTGIPDILRQEMRAGGSDSENADETTVEYRVLAASLSSIPIRDRDACNKCFRVFALVAEDTFVPISAFRILLSAVTAQQELVPDLQVRRWLQVLINRSVVLGSWERPSLHDIGKCTVCLYGSARNLCF